MIITKYEMTAENVCCDLIADVAYDKKHLRNRYAYIPTTYKVGRM